MSLYSSILFILLGLPFKFQRRQFPISLCFAMTINKSQGQTLSRVGLYLPQPVSHMDNYMLLFLEWKPKEDWKYLYWMKMEMSPTQLKTLCTKKFLKLFDKEDIIGM